MSVMHFVPQLKNSDAFPARREQSVVLTLGSVRLFVEDRA